MGGAGERSAEGQVRETVHEGWAARGPYVVNDCFVSYRLFFSPAVWQVANADTRRDR